MVRKVEDIDMIDHIVVYVIRSVEVEHDSLLRTRIRRCGRGALGEVFQASRKWLCRDVHDRPRSHDTVAFTFQF